MGGAAAEEEEEEAEEAEDETLRDSARGACRGPGVAA